MKIEKDILKKYAESTKEVLRIWDELGFLTFPSLKEGRKIQLAELYNETANYILDNPSKEDMVKNFDLIVAVFPLEAKLFLNFRKIYDYSVEKIIDIIIENGDRIYTQKLREHRDIDVEAEVVSELTDMVYEYYKSKETSTINVKFKKLHPDAIIPKYSHDGDVCMDMTAIGMDYDAEHDMYIYHTGLAFESDKNIGQFLFLRSSNCKTDAYLCNGVGVADSAIYRGEIQFRMKNRTSTREFLRNRGISEMCKNLAGGEISPGAKIELFLNNLSDILNNQLTPSHEDLVKTALELAPYKVGDRVGQMVFMHYPTVTLTEVKELSDTSRGDGGFGSTGK